MAIPPSLASLRQWVSWKYETRDGKQTKVPVDPHTGSPASVTNPTTWGTYEEAGRRDGRNIGFVFTGSDPFVAIDLDGCRNPATGDVAPWAQEIITALDSYTEISPSGTGIHVLVRGTLPGRGRKRHLEQHSKIGDKQPTLEVYGQGRFFTITGKQLPNTPDDVQDRQAQLQALYTAHFSESPDSEIVLTPLPEPSLPLRLGARLKELIVRGWSDGCGFPSPSELDFAVATEMLRNGHTAAEVVWVFTSPLFGFSRGKHHRPDYIQRTIAAAQAAAQENKSAVGLQGHTVKELRAMPFEDEKTLVDRLVFDKSITLVAGPPKIGKTLWVMQLMASLAVGRPFLDTFGVGEPVTSLHMTAELPSKRYRDRWERFFALLFPGAEERIVVCSEKAISIEADFDRVCRLIETHKPRLVVFDPWVRYHEGDENKADEMKHALEQLDRLINKYGVAILIVHHLRKRGMGEAVEDMEQIRGNTVLRSHPNVNILLVPRDMEYGDDEIVRTIRMKVESNFGEPERPLILVRGEHGLFERDGAEKRADVGKAMVDILRSVSERELPKTLLVKRLSESYGIPKPVAERKLDSPILPIGVVVELREGIRWYTLRETEGEAA